MGDAAAKSYEKFVPTYYLEPDSKSCSDDDDVNDIWMLYF